MKGTLEIEKDTKISIPPRSSQLVELPEKTLGLSVGDKARLTVKAGKEGREYLLTWFDFELNRDFIDLLKHGGSGLEIDLSWLASGRGFVFVRDGMVYSCLLEAEVSERLITDELYGCRFPSVSPDGRKLLVVAGGESDNDVIYTMDSAGAASPEPVVEGEILSPPAWHPDSARIAYQDGRSIYSTDLSGNSHALIAEAGIQGYPVWSRDGEAIAYCHSERPEGPWQLRAVALCGMWGSTRIEKNINPGADITFGCEIHSIHRTTDEHGLTRIRLRDLKVAALPQPAF